MYDSILFNIQLAEKRSHILENLKLKPKNYALATVHRPENTDNHERLKSIFYAFEQISQDGLPVIIPLHPRTRQSLENSEFRIQDSKLRFIDPVSYLDMLLLEKNAQVILTDSGGVQKEAYWFGVPCVTLRDETEWLETVETGWNVLAGSNYDRIINAVEKTHPGQQVQDAYGNGRAAERIATLISSFLP
jgi:UDP-N-acetylglucosamine 2-epimerase